MRLVSLTLHNIRSYTNATVEFPTGTVMLSGDIGSGKSTILLAIEFALFGLLRGELAGTALLRNGANTGSVELTFTVNNTTHTIHRTLKRTKKSVEQDAGYLLTNGAKQAATATELKSRILDILGYPQELLTKSKNFVYRYTVYTPQEEMKRILLEDAEQRVAILRKVFDIDKYERITQNAGTYAKLLRERQRALDVLVADLQEKKQQAAQTQTELEAAKKELAAFTPKIETARKQLETSKQQLNQLEQQKQQAELLTREFHVAKTQLQNKEQQKQQTSQDLTTISQQLAQQQQPENIDTSQLLKKKQELQQQLAEKEQHWKNANQKLAELNTLKQQALQTTQQVNSLDHCPTCLQNVSHEHKHHIITTQQQKTQEADQQLNQHHEQLKQHEQSLAQLRQEQETLQQQEKQAALANVQRQRYQDLAARKTQLEQQHTTLQEDIHQASQRLSTLKQQLEPLNNINTLYDQLKKEHDTRLQEERQLSITHSTLQQKQQHLHTTLEKLTDEVKKKEQHKHKLEQTRHAHHWLTDYFIPLMDVIEKHVLAKIHHEFDALFQQWFSILIEDTMTARLDELFTPLIQQNGHDTGVENLSGGEKTACALAYRLALNKTINSLISGINTKNLLMLDEPTDGFSAEQLDKMRDVLEQLRLSQVIIVSHEQQIESFADHIIRVSKHEHTSQIA